ncbi:hypothetical protein [Herpetosiphon llansteffanensis]|uniref:hypothetical protein n=1 Tax=Herpetosiphon llansteffanensis TaxID=2094568 RepID=UPI00196A9387|nr:hypothetical protein [Herpetosiphon llansteffanensis]
MSEPTEPETVDQEPNEEPASRKLNAVEAEAFDYSVSKAGKVFISWYGKQVMILNGPKAQRFLANIADLEGEAAQLVMAKITGNFKRGNERLAKEKSR